MALLSRVSTPQTPGTPQTITGGLPSTPGPSSQPAYPTPLTPAPLRTPAPPLRPPPSSIQAVVQPVVVPPAPLAVTFPVSAALRTTVTTAAQAANIMAAAKLLGTLPKAFDGSLQKAEAFWNSLANYYYLNSGVYTDEGKWVSAVLTHFKLGTPAGDWAEDRTKTALTPATPDFGTWAASKAVFKKHFIPELSALEATNAMYTFKMGNKPFNEWYQEWSTHASRSGANEQTQMYAFRKAIPIALHQKLLTVSPPQLR